MALRTLLTEYLSAYNNHDINSILSFLHPDCRVMFNGQVWLQGIDALKGTYEKDFLDPQASATVIECHEDTNDRIRVLLQTRDHRQIDVTYVFDSTNDGPNKRRMIEHLIHSVKSEM